MTFREVSGVFCFTSLVLLSSQFIFAGEEPSALSIVQKAVPDAKWDASAPIEADINCDGVKDFSFLGKTNDNYFVATVPGPISNSSIASVVKLLNSGGSQDGVSGENPILTQESTDYDLTEALGDNPTGFKRSTTCKGLNLSSGYTDPFHFYWNHKENKLDWWRM